MADLPGVYVHFEFGMSWPRRPSLRNHQVTYISKSARDRASKFPRHVPPANTNFLAVPSYPQHYHDQHGTTIPNAAVAAGTQIRTARPGPNHEALQAALPPAHFRETESPDQERRSRSDSRSSHERGRSAPAPFNESPWDARAETVSATVLPRTRNRHRTSQVEIWKPLPATPGQYRLGESDMPWSPSPFQVGFIEDGEVEDGLDAYHARATDRATVVPRLRQVDDRARGRAREMQSFATAMMTIDNGFEDQWWYQGQRMFNIAGDLISPPAMVQRYTPDGTVGWAVAGGQPPMESTADPLHNTPSVSSVVDIVSPISDFSSPSSNPRGLRRSWTTRSDELHM